MIVTKIALQRKIDQVNKWLKNHPKTHFSYGLKTQNRNYYVGKMCIMDESELKKIKI